MLQTLQVVTLLLVAAAWSFALAHAAEMPGKRQLDRTTYFAVQRIYYPGFTIGGISEPLAVVALIVLLAVTGLDDPASGGIALALVAVAAAHAVFWFMTQPINKLWVKDLPLGRAGAAFFGSSGNAPTNWTQYRDRWDHSHLIRCGLLTVALVDLAVALTD